MAAFASFSRKVGSISFCTEQSYNQPAVFWVEMSNYGLLILQAFFKTIPCRKFSA